MNLGMLILTNRVNGIVDEYRVGRKFLKKFFDFQRPFWRAKGRGLARQMYSRVAKDIEKALIKDWHDDGC
jgi:hypothetical protein